MLFEREVIPDGDDGNGFMKFKPGPVKVKKTVLIYSGGLDSTSLLYMLVGMYGPENIVAIGFNYGQRHDKELIAAMKIAALARVQYRIMNLSGLAPLLKGSSQTDPKIQVPEGHYAAENMKLTIVPNRNMIMLSIAVAHAISLQYDQVAFGAHAGDHYIYPDCRPNFVAAMNQATNQCDDKKIEIIAPFIHLDKGGCAIRGAQFGAPLELTWSCYKGEEFHCGKCGACTERKEAFQKAMIQDPTTYA